MPNLAKQVREQHPGATVAKRTRNSIHLDTGGGRRGAEIHQGKAYTKPPGGGSGLEVPINMTLCVPS